MRSREVTSAVSCLREALGRESDKGTREFMQSTLEELEKR
jgi:hypothetical protein